MKNIISFVLSLIVFLTLIFWVDGWLVKTIVNAFPASAKDWLTLIRIVAWVAVLWATFGLALLISSIIYWIIRLCLDYNKIDRSFKAARKAVEDREESKSKWQQRVEEIQKRNNKN